MILDELFKEAKKYGITKCMVIKEIYGTTNCPHLYTCKNPTEKTINRVRKTIEILKNKKK